MRFHRCFLFLSLVIITSGCGTIRPKNAAVENQLLLKPEYRSSDRSQLSDSVEPETRGFWHQTLWYVPNRVLDLTDIFRIKVRAGPGVAANVRVTDYANFYWGFYNTAFLGLPGPRMGPELRSPLGREQERGILIMGVDATDDLPHEPWYSPTEFNLGLHVLIVGAEVGFDPVELGDFLAGFLLYDIREDDR